MLLALWCLQPDYVFTKENHLWHRPRQYPVLARVRYWFDWFDFSVDLKLTDYTIVILLAVIKVKFIKNNSAACHWKCHIHTNVHVHCNCTYNIWNVTHTWHSLFTKTEPFYREDVYLWPGVCMSHGRYNFIQIMALATSFTQFRIEHIFAIVRLWRGQQHGQWKQHRQRERLHYQYRLWRESTDVRVFLG